MSERLVIPDRGEAESELSVAHPWWQFSARFNVAVSRAQCLAVLVHSPRLLDADCRTLKAMEMVDGVCRFVELAESVR